MKINKIILENFGLFKNQEIDLQNINLITGINLDSETASSNGSGKSTLISAILFALFGEAGNVNLSDLVKIGTKQCSVTLDCTINKCNVVIIRKIPKNLQIFVNDGEVKHNTQTIAQSFLNELLDTDFNKFRTYQIIDNSKGINLLDLGITSLRKTMIDFVNTDVLKTRNALLAKKLISENTEKMKVLNPFFVSEKRLNILETNIKNLKEEETNSRIAIREQQKVLTSIEATIASHNNMIVYKQNELKKAQEGICPILKTTCEKLGKKMLVKDKKVLEKEIKTIEKRRKEALEVLSLEEDYMNNIQFADSDLTTKINRATEFLKKLQSAKKFKELNKSEHSAKVYADAIKVLDSFSGYYINQWLETLAIIINDLLTSINISIQFSETKDFMIANNNGQILKYEQCSSGQRKFLGTIFKIGILLQEGINSGVLIFDEGLNEIAKENLEQLINVLKNLNYQSVIVYQNVDKSLQDVNYINIERKNNESNIL